MKIIDNVIDDEYSNYLNKIVFEKFPWYFLNTSAYENEKIDFSYSFYHILAEDNKDCSNYSQIFYPLILKCLSLTNLKDCFIKRARLGLITKFHKKIVHSPHIDYKEPHSTILYYLNNSDGDTFVFNEQYGDEFNDLTIAHRQTPTEGCALLFKSINYHASSSPINTKSRVVINIVFESDETKRR